MALSNLLTWNWNLILQGLAALANLVLAYTAFRVIREARATQQLARSEAAEQQQRAIQLNRPLFVLDRVYRFSYWEETSDAEQGISVIVRNARPHPALSLRYRLKYFLISPSHEPDLIRETTGVLAHPVPEGEPVHLHSPKNPWFGMPGLHYLGVELEYRDPLSAEPYRQDFTLYLRLRAGVSEIDFEPLCDLLLADKLRELRMASASPVA
ncbi:MAG: hypothetical protein HYZ13_03175 [Acidobacteria bacterium]|nr:hypothetical protein [Acidobacteriota bacterium]